MPRWRCTRGDAERFYPSIGTWRHCHCYRYGHRHTTPVGTGTRPNGIVIRVRLCDGTKIYRPELACCIWRDYERDCPHEPEHVFERTCRHETRKFGVACPGKRGRRMNVTLDKNGEYDFWGFMRKSEEDEQGLMSIAGETIFDEQTEEAEELVVQVRPRREPWFNEDRPIEEGRELFEDGVPLPRYEPEARVVADLGQPELADIEDPETWSEDRQLAELYRLGILHDDHDLDELQPQEAPFQLGEIHHAEPEFKVKRVVRKRGGKKGQVQWWSEVDEIDDDRGFTEAQLEVLQRQWDAEAFDFVMDDDISSLEGSWMDVAEV